MKYLALKVRDDMIINHLVTGTSFIDILNKVNWRITARKLKDVTHAIIIYKGTIIKVYEISEGYIVHPSDISIKFKFVPLQHESDLVGKQLNYRTSNTASILTDTKILTITKR